MDVTWHVICMAISALCCLFAPAAAAVILILKKKANVRAFLAGIAAFGVSQLLLRIPILNLLQNAAWYNLFITTNTLVYLLLLALSAGIFEETGRFLSMKLFMKGRYLTWENGVVFGLGHGGIEAFWLIGISSAVLFVNTLSGVDTAAVLNAPPYAYLLGALERVLTIAVHTGFTMLVLYAVKYQKPIYLLYAVLSHMLVDCTVILRYLGINLDVWAAEGIIAVFAALAVILTIKFKPALTRQINTNLEEQK